MNYYSNELKDNFIEIDDTISNEEYHADVSKEKEKEKSSSPTLVWDNPNMPPINYYNPQWLLSQQNVANTQRILDAQQCNTYRQDLRTLMNSCQTQLMTNPTNFIQQQLNTSCNNLENGLRNLYDTISKIMED